MELAEADIKERIADGRIRGLSLDTSIFHGNGNRFEQGLRAKLKQFKNTPEVDMPAVPVALCKLVAALDKHRTGSR